jgi:hypothetical protein
MRYVAPRLTPPRFSIDGGSKRNLLQGDHPPFIGMPETDAGAERPTPLKAGLHLGPPQPPDLGSREIGWIIDAPFE